MARICHVFDTINAKYVLTATEGGSWGFEGCSGLFSLSAKKEGRKGLFDKPDTCVLFSPCIRLQTFSYREPACARTIHHFQGKPEFHVEPVISKLEAMILEITAALDTGIMRVDGAYQHCTPSIQ